MSCSLTSRYCVGLLAAMLGIAPVAASFAASGQEHCADHFKLKGPCFTVHGRLRVYNGNPSVRIWPIGSHRLLGVATVSDDPENPQLPFPLNQGLDVEAAYFAEYTVCPLGPDVRGEMRYVCLDSIANVVNRKD
jgi:hypothetical protein